jgi:hypothetical protein
MGIIEEEVSKPYWQKVFEGKKIIIESESK